MIKLKYNKPKTWILLNDKEFNVTAHYIVKKKRLTIYKVKDVYPKGSLERKDIYEKAISEFMSGNLDKFSGWYYFLAIGANIPSNKSWATYKDYLKSDEWYKIRAQKVEDADRRCQLCYNLGNLQVHHRTYIRIFNEKLSDLTVLCKRCHEKFHDIINVSEPV